MVKEEVVSYLVLGSEVNTNVAYLQDRNQILTARSPHFSGSALIDFKMLNPEIDGFEKEKERAETVYKMILANPGKVDIDKFELEGKKLMHLKIREYTPKEIETINNFVEVYETDKKLARRFFF